MTNEALYDAANRGDMEACQGQLTSAVFGR
jgi:hypothetical protein